MDDYEKTALSVRINNILASRDTPSAEVFTRKLLEEMHDKSAITNELLARIEPSVDPVSHERNSPLAGSHKDLARAMWDLIDHDEHGDVAQRLLTEAIEESEMLQGMNETQQEEHLEKKRDEFAQKIKTEHGTAIDGRLNSLNIDMAKFGVHEYGEGVLTKIGTKHTKENAYVPPTKKDLTLGPKLLRERKLNEPHLRV